MLQDYGKGQFIVSGIFRRLSDAIRGLSTAGIVDVVLLDISLPDSPSGIDTFLRLSHAAPEQPVIVLSGYDDEQLAIQTVQQGAQDYLVKYEITGKLLIRSIHYAIERKRTELALKAAREELEKRVTERTHALTESNRQLSNMLKQLKAAQELASHQERLHAMERLAAGIAHDFNNALSPILALSEWLLRKPEAISNETGIKKALSNIHESATHCAEVVVRLREFCSTSNESSRLEPLDLREVVQEAICLTQPSWKDQAQTRGCNILIETQFANVPKIEGAKKELIDLFANLIFNSVDAIAEEGVIAIRITANECESVSVSVSDNGSGMDEEVCHRCMEPFFTTKKGRGVGLGLGVVYGIARRHNAQVTIESTEGSGTKVIVEFPVSHSSSAPKPREVTIQAPKPLRKLRILAVEDEPSIRDVLSLYLAEDGHSVELAADGTEALEKFEKGQFDLLLTDYSMPNMNGDDLAAAIRERDPRIRIALLTGFGSQLPQGAPLRLEVDAIISKPFTFESLRQGILEAMGG